MMKHQYFLPLLTYPEMNSSFLIANAIEVARHCGATLHSCAIDVVVPELSPAQSPFVDMNALARQAEVFSRDRGETLTQLVKDAASKTDTDAIVRNLTVAEPFVADTVAEFARCFDLTIMEVSDVSREIVEAVLFGSGRPLLLIPPRQVSGRFDHIVVAWDGSRAASRALADAGDFLDRATQITLLSIADEEQLNFTPRCKISDILEKKGLSVKHHVAQARGSPIADALQDYAIENDADLLVAGGFGHSRFREFMLGGVTRSVLSYLKLPVLMSH